MAPLASYGLAAALAIAHTANGADDIFAVSKEPSPREAAVAREMRAWANRTTWDGRRVVAAMTTTPKRIALIEPALNSLVQQSRPLDMLYLFVPHVFRRDGSAYELPPWLVSKRGVNVVRCEDSGPATHMLEVLRRERGPNTFILQVDDDQHYGHRLLETLLSSQGPLPGRAVGAATQHAHTHLGGVVLEGVHGVLFQRKLFDPTVFDFDGFSPSCRLHDDLWLSAHLAKRAVRRESLGSRFGSTALPFGFGDDALYKGGAGSDNTRNLYLCMASLVRKHPRLWDPVDRVALAAPLLPSFGRDATAAAATLRRLRQLRRERETGPHALYLLGPVPPAEAGSEVSVEFEDGVVLRSGGWGDGVDVVVRECKPNCGVDNALEFALSFEEDPEAVIVLFDAPLPRRGLQKLLAKHLRCLQSLGRSSRELCRSRGSTSFRRHAAYEASRVQGGIFLPAFSSQFHQPWVEGWHLDGKGMLWRDEGGPWRAAPNKRSLFASYLSAQDETILAYQQEWAAVARRAVATLAVGCVGGELLRLGATLRSLLRQQSRLRRVYVFAAPRCAIPGWVAARPRVVVARGSGAAAPLAGLLGLEASPETLVLHCTNGHRYSWDLLGNLIRAADLWPGKVVACQGSIYGQHGGPVASAATGTLYRRSFLDTGLTDDLTGPCAEHLDLAVSAQLSLRGVQTVILGNSFGTRRLGPRRRSASRSKCRALLVHQRPWLWASQAPERCVLFVSLLEGTDGFLLGLTLHYAGLQTRKPDEVVLLAPRGGLLDIQRSARPRAWAEAELELSSGSSALVRTRAGQPLEVSLVQFLGSLRDRAGCLVRMRSGFGPPRSFVLSVTSCLDGLCSVQPILRQSFERELDPNTALVYTSAERLVNERLVEENVRCISFCKPRCSKHSWCGQSATRSDGAIYDLTIRRTAGYVDYVPG